MFIWIFIHNLKRTCTPIKFHLYLKWPWINSDTDCQFRYTSLPLFFCFHSKYSTEILKYFKLWTLFHPIKIIPLHFWYVVIKEIESLFSHAQKASNTFHALLSISSDLTPRSSLKKTATQLCVQKKAVTRTSTILKTSPSCTQLTHWSLCRLTENKDWRVYIYSYATGSHLRNQVEVCLKNIFEIAKSFINCISMYFED